MSGATLGELAEVAAPFVEVEAADGAMARVYLDGAQVAEWRPAGTRENALFVSAQAQYGAGVSIRGGVPVCFPQFGPGRLPQHGFARHCRWRVVELVLREFVVLELGRCDLPAEWLERAAAWPHDFQAQLRVGVSGSSLELTLQVVNTDSVPFDFTAALHPYFAVRDASHARVHGLAGLTYRDALAGGAEFVEQGETVSFPGNVDRVYYDAPDVLELRDAVPGKRERVLRIEKRGFPDAVVWNPGPEGTASRADFAPGDERKMVCVEAGAIREPVVLEPGGVWRVTQRVVWQS